MWTGETDRDETERDGSAASSREMGPGSSASNARGGPGVAPGHRTIMYQSPRMRRLRNDLAALERLRSESSVFRFVTKGDLPQYYHILFQGKGLWRDRGKVRFHETHRIEIKLGASYPGPCPRSAG